MKRKTDDQKSKGGFYGREQNPAMKLATRLNWLKFQSISTQANIGGAIGALKNELAMGGVDLSEAADQELGAIIEWAREANKCLERLNNKIDAFYVQRKKDKLEAELESLSAPKVTSPFPHA